MEIQKIHLPLPPFLINHNSKYHNKMLKFLLSVFALVLIINVSNACTAIIPSPANPTAGQTVNFSLSGCSSTCFYPCFYSSGQWTISCQGSFVIGGVTYYNTAQVSGPGVSVLFNSSTNATITFSANCTYPCGVYVRKTLTIGTPPPPPVTHPATSLVPTYLVDVWKTAGANKNLLPTAEQCINIHNQADIPPSLYPIVTSYSTGYKVNVARLNSLISSTDVTKTSVVYFQAANYFFDKGATINLSKNNLILSGEGADKTRFIIDDLSTSHSAGAKDFIVASNRKSVGITCLDISTNRAFPYTYWHEKSYNDRFNNRAIIKFNNTEHSWVQGVDVFRGYGATVHINGKGNNEVKNCYFYDQWTLGGPSGGTQGYSVLINNSDNNLIENNRFRLARHNVVIQGSGNNNSTSTNDLSSGNVVAYNYCHEGEAKREYDTQDYPWNITFHGRGKNANNLVESNYCEDRMAVDDVHGSNGPNNTFYRNLSKTQIEVEKGTSCNNEQQRFILNTVYKRGTRDRYNIKGDDHIVRGNRKCDSNGGNCNSGSYNVGNKCGVWPFSGSNQNTSLSSGAGQSCYLIYKPSFLNNLPLSPEFIPAKNYNTAPSIGCYTCTNVILPESATIDTEDEEPTLPTNKVEATKVEQIAKVTPQNTTNLDVLVFPNPTSGKVTIQIAGAAISSNAMFQLFALSGELLDTRNINLDGQNSFEYDLSKFSTGIYIGTIIDDEKLYRVKIVKQ